jgi:CRISPR-associated endonuclease/helicase Cas3
VTLPDTLAGQRLDRRLALSLSAALGGHHSVFAQPEEMQRLASRAAGRGRWVDARRALVERLASMSGVAEVAPPQHLPHATAMFLAGLVSVADWVGSDERYFPYALPDASATPTETPEQYAARAAKQARRALAELRWTGWKPDAERRTFQQLFPGIAAPNAAQLAVIELASQLERHQGLVILEAPMGQGKTEAALYLADRWGAALGQRGCYFALPTMATSNQMFGRVRDLLRQRYPHQFVNLQLLHGHALLSAELATLRDLDRQILVPHGIHDERSAGLSGAPPDVVAAKWFTYRKRGLLAPFAVGTVDQALLAALPKGSAPDLTSARSGPVAL